MSHITEGSKKNFAFYPFGTSSPLTSLLFKVALLKAALSHLFFPNN